MSFCKNRKYSLYNEILYNTMKDRNKETKRFTSLVDFIKYDMTYSELIKRSIKSPDFVIWINGPKKIGKEFTIRNIVNTLRFERTKCVYKYKYFTAYLLYDFIKIPETTRSDGKIFFNPNIYIFKSSMNINNALQKELLYNNCNSTELTTREYKDIERRINYEIIFSIEGNKKPTFIDILRNSRQIVKQILVAYRHFLISKGYYSYIRLLKLE
nr:CPPV289 hypothetical protein [Cooks petrelpox virus]